MSDNDLMLGMSRRSVLRAEVAYLMLKGAGYAALLVVGLWFSLALLAWFGRAVLPEEAQMAADPAPQDFADFAARARAADAAMMAPAEEPVAAEEPAAMEEAPAEEPAAMEAAPAVEEAPAEEAPAEAAAPASE